MTPRFGSASTTGAARIPRSRWSSGNRTADAAAPGTCARRPPEHRSRRWRCCATRSSSLPRPARRTPPPADPRGSDGRARRAPAAQPAWPCPSYTAPGDVAPCVQFHLGQGIADLLDLDQDLGLIGFALALQFQHVALMLEADLLLIELQPRRVDLLLPGRKLRLHPRQLLGLSALRRRLLVAGIGEEPRRVLQVGVADDLRRRGEDVPRRHREAEAAPLDHLHLLLPDLIQMQQ